MLLPYLRVTARAVVEHLPVDMRWRYESALPVSGCTRPIYRDSGTRLWWKPGWALLCFERVIRAELNATKGTVRLRGYASANPQDVERLLGGPILALWLEMKGCLVLHGSGLCSGNRVVGFIGPSMAGKTTIARMGVQRGWHLWADDYLTVLRRNSRLLTIRSRPQLRLRTSGHDRAVVPTTKCSHRVHRLDRLFVLRRSGSANWKVERLGGIESVREVLCNLYFGRVGVGRDARSDALALDLASQAVIFRLHAPEGEGNLRTAWAEIRKWADV